MASAWSIRKVVGSGTSMCRCRRWWVAYRCRFSRLSVRMGSIISASDACCRARSAGTVRPIPLMRRRSSPRTRTCSKMQSAVSPPATAVRGAVSQPKTCPRLVRSQPSMLTKSERPEVRLDIRSARIQDAARRRAIRCPPHDPTISLILPRDTADHSGLTEPFPQAIDRVLGGGAAFAALIDKSGRISILRGSARADPEADQAGARDPGFARQQFAARVEYLCRELRRRAERPRAGTQAEIGALELQGHRGAPELPGL